jgi:hypothetical protein
VAGFHPFDDYARTGGLLGTKQAQVRGMCDCQGLPENYSIAPNPPLEIAKILFPFPVKIFILAKSFLNGVPCWILR